MAKAVQVTSFPALLRVTSRAKSLNDLLQEAIAAGLPAENSGAPIEDFSAIDPSLTTEKAFPAPPPPASGTSYAGLTPAQRDAFLSWSRKPENPAPPAYQQLYLANLEARLIDPDFQLLAIEKLGDLTASPAWAKNLALDRAYLLSCWLLQDGPRLIAWVSDHPLPADLLGIAFGLQALMPIPLAAAELGAAIASWKLGNRLPTDLLKLRLDSLTAILGQPPLAYALGKVNLDALTPRPWRTSHRGLRLLIPQPDLRQILEPTLRELLAVADVSESDSNTTLSQAPESGKAAGAQEESEQPSLEELGWRLILEFGSNRSEYFDYVLIQAQKLPGYSQLMDEDRRIVYRVIFRKSEMRRFWRLWDYVHGWTSTRVYLNGEELEKWKVWPYSQYLR
jgi:hypothetical protein